MLIIYQFIATKVVLFKLRLKIRLKNLNKIQSVKF
jgi:hypothetical protein